MKTLRRVLTVVGSILISLVFLSHAALADGITTYAASDLAMMEGTNPETLLEECFDDVGENAENAEPITYKHFLDAEEAQQDINLDYYLPPDPLDTSHPAVVLVHGGGFVAGCRSELDPLAVAIANKGYLVFNVDYRLACSLAEHEEVWLCGTPPWAFAVPPADIRSAIKWVRDHADEYGAFTGVVVGIGTSGGGNLIYDAGVTATGDYKPDVMAGVSPFAELGYMSNHRAMCQDSADQGLCQDNTEAFMAITLTHPPGQFQCADSWQDASPACNISNENPPPPTFIANATEELSTLLAEQDFDALLEGPPVVHLLCAVGVDDPRWEHFHGTRLLNPDVECDGTDDSVFDTMMGFIADNLP
jgi:acetyl esterase/lipase